MGLSKSAAERAELIAATEAFFLKAMREHSWAAGVKGKKLAGAVDVWLNEFKEGGFHFKQMYRIFNAHFRPDPSRVFLSDTINISFEEQDVWFMTLNGHCKKGDLSFLQRVLMEAYVYEGAGNFHGGRGLLHHTEKEYLSRYDNSAHGSFRHFGGTEKIRPLGKIVTEQTGFAEYGGWFIIPRPE